MTIGDRIRRIRKKRRLTQAELAMMSGLSLSAIQGYEQGRYEPKRKSLESIAEVFKIPVYELYDTPAQLGTNLAEVGTDCISKKQAIDAVEFGITYAKAINRETGEVTELFNESNNELREAVDRIKQLPPIQPKRGRWIPVDAFTAFGGDEATWMAHGNPTAFHYCSVCKGQAYAGEDGESLLTDFCPNCGADMRGEQDG